MCVFSEEVDSRLDCVWYLLTLDDRTQWTAPMAMMRFERRIRVLRMGYGCLVDSPGLFRYFCPKNLTIEQLESGGGVMFAAKGETVCDQCAKLVSMYIC